ncbi:hypothetical protein [Aeromonas dhakensis]|jgi:hypothetical protein|uniref:hypothetical protein n=1 Tax=Aeromonas dhakensis TaxID=196024 RepID=UPI002447365B|nr:hypothetical protein [Aeromonas dhakensis]MDH0347608.1 hypothetical protein [Aeromonas dhakensis]
MSPNEPSKALWLVKIAESVLIMSIFLVVATPDSVGFVSDRLGRIAIDADRFEVSTGVWAVDVKGVITPKEVVDKVVDEGELPSGFVVFPLQAYWGFHNPALWGWLNAHGL